MTFERLLGSAFSGLFYPVLGADSSGTLDASDNFDHALDQAALTRGIVLWPSGTFKLTREFRPAAGVSVYGMGGGALKGSAADPAYTPATTLKWAGVSGGTLLRTIRVQGVDYSGFAVDGTNTLGRAFHMTCHQAGHIRDLSTINMGSQNNPAVHGIAMQIESNIFRVTGDVHSGTKILDNLVFTGEGSTADLTVGMTVTGANIPGGTTISSILTSNSVQTSANSTGNATGQAIAFSTASNSHSLHLAHLNFSAAQCMLLDGDSIADVPITRIEQIAFLFGSGTGNEDCINGNYTDNVTWTQVYCFKNFGTGFGFHGMPNCRNHYFRHIYPATTGMSFEAPASATWANRVDGYQRNDGAAAPTLAAGANLTYSEDGVNATGWYQTQDFIVNAVGKGLRVKEGTNAKQGLATLGAAGTVVVNNTSVTANSRIFLTVQNGAFAGAMRVSARVAGTSFTIASSAGAGDNGATVAWEMFEPA